MCEHGTTVRMPIGGRVRDIDSCIVDIVAALNAGGVPTVASCCGHGHRPGSIPLEDGRELMIHPSYEAAREADKHWPLDIHGHSDVLPSKFASCKIIELSSQLTKRDALAMSEYLAELANKRIA